MSGLRYLFIVFVGFIGAVSCEDQRASHEELKEFVLLYPSRVLLPTGKTIPATFSEGKAKEVLRSYEGLKYSILVCSPNLDEPNMWSTSMFVVGRFPDGERDDYQKPVGKEDMSGGFERREFILEGWGILVPYYEYPQHPTDGSLGLPPIFRTQLRESDFEIGISYDLIKSDEKLNIFWVGAKPSSDFIREFRSKVESK